MTERTFLRRAVLGAGCAALAGCGAPSDEETTADDAEGMPTVGDAEGADVPTAGDEAIETHRKGPLEVSAKTPDGEMIPDAAVSVSMLEHAFAFGTSVDARYLVEDADAGGPYRRRLTELFNTAVVEHRNKWRPWEDDDERAYALEASSWLRERGLDLRGHTVVWQRFDEPVVPEDVVDAVQSDDPREEYVARRAREHVADIVGRYAGTVTDWDLLNEQIHVHQLTDVIDPDASKTDAPELLRWFEIARDADPETTLYVNEYDVLAGDDPETREAYERLARHLLDNGADVGGIGLQGHFETPGDARPAAATRETFDRYADLGVDLKVTEYSTHGDEWTEAAAADHLETFLRTTFAHPALVGFVMWGFWDGAHWADEAPLFREDWSEKPAGDVYRSLVFDEWWTDESGRTDDDGAFRTDVFLGDHEVRVAAGGTSETTRVTVTDADEPTQVDVRLSLD